jgi:hypothetical protein
MQNISHPFQTRTTEPAPTDAELLDDAFIQSNGVRDYDETEAAYAAFQCDRDELIASFHADPEARKEMAALECRVALDAYYHAYGQVAFNSLITSCERKVIASEGAAMQRSVAQVVKEVQACLADEDSLDPGLCTVFG